MTGGMMAPDLNVGTIKAFLERSFPTATPEQVVGVLQDTIEAISQERGAGTMTMPSRDSHMIESLLSGPLDYYVHCHALGPIEMFGQIGIKSGYYTSVQFEGRQGIPSRIGYAPSLNSGTLFSQKATPIGGNTRYSKLPTIASAYDGFAPRAPDMETLSLCRLINLAGGEESALIVRFKLDSDSGTGLDVLIALSKENVEALARVLQNDPSTVNQVVRRLDVQLVEACSFNGTKITTDTWYLHASRNGLERTISQHLETREY